MAAAREKHVSIRSSSSSSSNSNRSTKSNRSSKNLSKRINNSTSTSTAGKGNKEEAEHEPNVDADKLSYEIFSILESKFLFGYDDHQLWPPKAPSLSASANILPLAVATPTGAAASDSSSKKNQRGKVCVLCIDGGGGCGMRGVLPGKALAYLEQALKARCGDPDARISDYFDVVAGTGVGGVFAAMLFATRDGARPLFSADDTWRFLVDHGKRLFRKAPTPSSPGLFSCLFPSGADGETTAMVGSTAAMERAMKEAFGESLTLQETMKPVLIPCYDLRSSSPLVFSRADALESESFNFRLWEVCRATWAEPGRFEPAVIRSLDGRTSCVGVDGGLATMSNPAAAAITHVLHNKQEFPFVRGVEDLMVLSLGCGVSATGAAAGEAELQRVQRWGAREWAQPIARIAADGAGELVDHAVALAFGQCRSSNYVRVQANGSTMGRCGGEVDYDPSPANVKALLEAAEEMIKQKSMESVLFGGRRFGDQTNMEKLDWFSGELILEHQRRSSRIAPTVAIKQAASKAANTI